jgi:hypothetical protein
MSAKTLIKKYVKSIFILDRVVLPFECYEGQISVTAIWSACYGISSDDAAQCVDCPHCG